MTKEKLEQLNHLTNKLRNERMKELVEVNGDEIEEYADKEIYEMDDGDNCLRMTVAEAYAVECTSENKQIPFIAIVNKVSGETEFDYADEYLETHGDLEVRQSLYIKKHNCVYIELLD